MRGNPPSTTSTPLLRIDFPSHPCSQLPCITFHGQGNIARVTEQREIPHERFAPQMSHFRYITPPHPPPTSHLSPTKVSATRASHHFTSLCVARVTFPFCFAKYFLHALNLLFLCYLCKPNRSYHLLGAAM